MQLAQADAESPRRETLRRRGDAIGSSRRRVSEAGDTAKKEGGIESEFSELVNAAY
jgi:hypothetical protein